MGRIYAVVLGALAFSTITFRTLIVGGSPEEAMRVASICVFLFAGFGWTVATIAEQTLDTAVRTRFARALRDRERSPHATQSN